MDIKEYAPLALRTAKSMENLRSTLVHGAMGCSSEPGELAYTAAQYADFCIFDRANIVEETGDCVWFAVYLAAVAGIGSISNPCVELVSNEPAKREGHPVNPVDFSVGVLRLCAAGSDIGTLIKAHNFYSKALDLVALENALRRYMQCVHNICAVAGASFSEVLEHNVAKLLERYPDKYSDAAAIARADKAA